MRTGRPTKLTPEIQKKICDAVAGGNYRHVAAQWAGISIRSLREWTRLGKRQKKGIYAEFLHALLKAEKEAEIRNVALIMQHAKEDPKHAEWWLERKFPKRWGRRERHDVHQTGQLSLEVNETIVTSRTQAESLLPAIDDPKRLSGRNGDL